MKINNYMTGLIYIFGLVQSSSLILMKLTINIPDGIDELVITITKSGEVVMSNPEPAPEVIDPHCTGFPDLNELNNI